MLGERPVWQPGFGPHAPQQYSFGAAMWTDYAPPGDAWKAYGQAPSGVPQRAMIAGIGGLFALLYGGAAYYFFTRTRARRPIPPIVGYGIAGLMALRAASAVGWTASGLSQYEQTGLMPAGTVA